MIGQTISHYKILEKLGEGGMGVVYKAEDTRLKRVVALKFLPSDLTRDLEAKERFIREAQAASALNHPNICSIHTIEEFQGQQFLDMEFVDGKVLSALISEKELSLPEILRISIQIAEGLCAAHKKDIVHRDIKPDNIMLTDDGLVKIMDFGLAKLKGTSTLTKPHSTLGTLFYMSPEQAQGIDVDQRSDIFSFGVVLYEMIARRRPFQGEHEAAVLYTLVNETPEPLAIYTATCPVTLQQIVDKSLAKQRDVRYQHVDEMLSDLRSAHQGTSVIIASSRKKSKMPWVVAAVVAAVAAVAGYFFYPPSQSAIVNRKSIAVLPFKNFSTNQEDEYFSDGMAEDIRTQLSGIADLKVISQQGVLRYKNSDKSITEIGKELGVATVLEGSVQHAGSMVRINAQLIDANDESHIWAEKYDKEMTQIFSVQSEVAEKIAEVLRAKLLPSEKGRIERKRTENTEAYQLYLKGRFYWNKRTASDLQKAIEYFNQAIEKDANYALAYAGLASAYAVLPEYSVPAKEALPQAEHAARRAMEIDGMLAEPHAVIGSIKSRYEFDYPGAEFEFKKAIELDPNYPSTRHWYSVLLRSLGRLNEALAESKRAQELDPLSLIINYNVGITLAIMRQYDQALVQFQNTLQLDSNYAVCYAALASVYEMQRKFNKAIEVAKKYRALAGTETDGLADLGYCYARMGNKIEAQRILNQLLDLSKRGYSVSIDIAGVYYGLWETDKIFEWLEKARDEKYAGLAMIGTDPFWEDLRPDPRFIAFMKTIGLEK